MRKALTITKANDLYLVSLLLLLTVGAVAQQAHFSIGLILTEVLCIFLPAWWMLRWQKVEVVRFHPLALAGLGRGAAQPAAGCGSLAGGDRAGWLDGAGIWLQFGHFPLMACRLLPEKAFCTSLPWRFFPRCVRNFYSVGC